MNVVRSGGPSSRGTSHNSLLAFNLLKTKALDSCARILSIVGRGWTSQKALAEIHSVTDRSIWFGTCYHASTHWCGRIDLEIIPSDSMDSNSAFTFDRISNSALPSVWRAKV